MCRSGEMSTTCTRRMYVYMYMCRTCLQKIHAKCVYEAYVHTEISPENALRTSLQRVFRACMENNCTEYTKHSYRASVQYVRTEV